MSKAGYLLDAGYNVLVFDLRGHGQSELLAAMRHR
jgi:alpha-beta hydrolase superfamily lysophospholipase